MNSIITKNTKTLFYIIGILWAAKKSLALIKAIYRAFLRPKKNLIQRYGQGSWAFVTGASDGIGKEFCRQLAKIGFNIILVARNQKKLEDAAKEIEKCNTNIKTHICVSDLSKCNNNEFLENINQQVGDRDISLVVNNAGLDHFEKFENLDSQHLKDLINVNCTTPVLICKNFIKRLTTRTNRGGIINVSSGSMVQYMPYFSAYAGSKSMVDLFTGSLADEFPNLDIISLKPFDVSTRMNDFRDTDIMTISAEKCVKGTLRDLGHQDGTYGHWLHKI